MGRDILLFRSISLHSYQYRPSQQVEGETYHEACPIPLLWEDGISHDPLFFLFSDIDSYLHASHAVGLRLKGVALLLQEIVK